MKQTYIPARVLTFLEQKAAEVTPEELNNVLYTTFPDISKRSLRSYSHAYRKKTHTDTLIRPHYTNDNFVTATLIPHNVENKDWPTWVSRVKALQKQNDFLRIANIQDVHMEHADAALVSMCLEIVKDFDPHLVPVMCDVVDNSIFSPRRHGSSYYNATTEVIDASVFYEEREEDFKFNSVSHAIRVFEKLTMHYIDGVRTVAPNAVLFTLLGNHEAWALHFIQQFPEVASMYLPRFFKLLKEREVLWPRASSQRELPLSDSVIALHGWSVRKSAYASNANNYLRYYEGMSVIAGHSHVMETAWSKPNFSTGGRNFAAVCGTLGTTRPAYMQGGYLAHTQGIQLIQIAKSGNIGHSVEDVYIHLKDGHYFARANGKEYRQKAANIVKYNPFTKE